MTKAAQTRLARKIKALLKCDAVRFWESTSGVYYVVIGYRRTTKDIKSYYYTNEKGERIDHDYLEEHTVAKGRTVGEVLKDVKYYHKLSKMTWAAYFKEFHNVDITPYVLCSQQL